MVALPAAPRHRAEFCPRVIIQVLGQAIKEDLKLTDLQLGLLTGVGFALLTDF